MSTPQQAMIYLRKKNPSLRQVSEKFLGLPWLGGKRSGYRKTPEGWLLAVERRPDGWIAILRSPAGKEAIYQ